MLTTSLMHCTVVFGNYIVFILCKNTVIFTFFFSILKGQFKSQFDTCVFDFMQICVLNRSRLGVKLVVAGSYSAGFASEGKIIYLNNMSAHFACTNAICLTTLHILCKHGH